jgi:hypothetical protein
MTSTRAKALSNHEIVTLAVYLLDEKCNLSQF